MRRDSAESITTHALLAGQLLFVGNQTETVTRDSTAFDIGAATSSVDFGLDTAINLAMMWGSTVGTFPNPTPNTRLQ